MTIDAVEDLADLWEESPGTIGPVELVCEFCGNYATHYVLIGGDVWFLCIKHRKAFTHQLAVRSKPVCECAEQPCPHEHTVLNTSGGMHYEDGEVWDDIEEEVLCLDCGEVIEPDEDDQGYDDRPSNSDGEGFKPTWWPSNGWDWWIIILH